MTNAASLAAVVVTALALITPACGFDVSWDMSAQRVWIMSTMSTHENSRDLTALEPRLAARRKKVRARRQEIVREFEDDTTMSDAKSVFQKLTTVLSTATPEPAVTVTPEPAAPGVPTQAPALVATVAPVQEPSPVATISPVQEAAPEATAEKVKRMEAVAAAIKSEFIPRAIASLSPPPRRAYSGSCYPSGASGTPAPLTLEWDDNAAWLESCKSSGVASWYDSGLRLAAGVEPETTRPVGDVVAETAAWVREGAGGASAPLPLAWDDNAAWLEACQSSGVLSWYDAGLRLAAAEKATAALSAADLEILEVARLRRLAEDGARVVEQRAAIRAAYERERARMGSAPPQKRGGFFGATFPRTKKFLGALGGFALQRR